MNNPSVNKKRKMSVSAAVHFAAPQTWPAAVLPSILGASIAAGTGHNVNPWILLGIIVTSVLLQAAVNTLNDYRDFVSGLDNEENCIDPEDAAMVYDCSDPKYAMILAFVFLAAAAVCGVTLVLFTSPVLFIFAAIGLAAILIYTVPAISFFRIPAGELLSGGTMGGVITVASYYAQTGSVDLKSVICCIPAVITIGGILTVNNTCDLEKDIQGGRRTFSICVGRKASQTTLRLELICTCIYILIAVLMWFPKGIAAMPAMVLALLFNGNVIRLFKDDMIPEVRREAMGGILASHKWIIGSFCAAMILHCLS